MNEYMYYRSDGNKDNPIRTKFKVPIGFLTVKRVQQMLSKKNTYSLDIAKRALKTNQVTGDDRTGKISSWDNNALSTIEADYALKEFLGCRADSADAKLELYKRISIDGYVYQKDLPNKISEKQTINTIYSYFIGAGIDTDLLDQPQTKELNFEDYKDVIGKLVDNETKKIK